ncbi:MAG: PemK-like, MazF-like toxin of type toxin-antitoxin system [Actinomycetota bacterium]
MTDVEARIERFRNALFAVDPEAVRDGIRRLPNAVSAAVHTAASVPFPALGRQADSRRALRRVKDLTLVVTVADAVAQPCLEVTLDLLGDAADDPTVEQLRAVVPTITEQFPMPIVRLMFASVAVSDAVAADKCDEILRDDLPAPEPADDEPTATTESPTVASRPAETSDEVRDARRARRRAQQEDKRKQQEARARGQQALRDAKRARPSTAPTGEADETPATRPSPEVTRRDAQLTPEQAKEFAIDDTLVGSVLIAVVPFDDDGPAQPGPQQKRRPCIVIGTSPSQLLVRPCYSEGGLQSRRWQSHPLRDWVAAGLDRATFVEDDARVISRIDAGDPLGRVSTEDWNALW